MGAPHERNEHQFRSKLCVWRVLQRNFSGTYYEKYPSKKGSYCSRAQRTITTLIALHEASNLDFETAKVNRILAEAAIVAAYCDHKSLFWGWHPWIPCIVLSLGCLGQTADNAMRRRFTVYIRRGSRYRWGLVHFATSTYIVLGEVAGDFYR